MPNRMPSKPQSPLSLNLETLEDRQMLSSVQILAAGVEGNEILQLEINEVAVQSWGVGGDAYGGSYQTLNYSTPEILSADDIRIRFTNDLYDVPNNIDRNLRVDAIVIDGVRFEAESPTVFSTGTWRPGIGIQPGFVESEFLHTDGYFQFASSGSNGSLINVVASGDEGGEEFRLLVDGSEVYRTAVTTTDVRYSIQLGESIAADQIRVEFLNDQWNPQAGIDFNLNVDFIEVDGERFETEAATVFSTGTWLAEDGIQPGFRQSETLHTNGYFQFADDAPSGGDVRLVQSVYNVSESGDSITIQAIRENGSAGEVRLDYTTINNTASAGSDYDAVAGVFVWADGEAGVKSVTIQIRQDAIVEDNETFGFTIDNLVGSATLLAPRTATVTIDDDDSILANGDGLLGEYFDGLNFTNRFTNRVDSIVAFDWGSSAPQSGMGADTFSVRWTGQIEPRYSELYTFETRSDDGIRLWVNNQLIIDEWNDHAPTTHTGQIFLEAGVQYDIRLEHYENGGQAVAELRWSSESQQREIVPQSQLYSADPPVTGDDLVTQTLLSGLSSPTSLDFTPDGQNMYISQKDGKVFTVQNGVLQSTPFIDISGMVNGVRDRGLLDIAVHPDFENTPYVYLLFTYDPPEVNNYTGLAGPDGRGNRAGRLIRVTADASNGYRTAVAGSEVVLLGSNSTWDNFNGFANSTNDFNEPPAGINPDGTNLRDFIASDSESHTVGAIEFGIDGNLFVSIGDGTSYNAMDPRTVRVQDIDNLSGKVLRIDPITGRGLSDNPFYNGDPDANRSKVYQLGLRNPFRMSVDPVSGQLYIGDVGWTQWEEVNAGGPGANFGWPYYEGGSGINVRTNQYQNLPEAQTFYASNQVATPAIYALNHGQTGINAIILGDVYSGDAYPEEYQGDLFFNDLGQGIVRNISFDSDGNITNVETFTGGAQIVVHIQTGPDGNLYFIDLNDGQVGRWVFQ